MLVGVPTELKSGEARVALTPYGAHELTSRGHALLIQRGAGVGSGFTDDAYVASGARLVDDAGEVFAGAEMIVKVKEPQPVEINQLRAGHVLFTYLHLAADPRLTHDLAGTGATCIAYETITDGDGGLPLLQPMSEIAGKLAAHAAAWALQRPAGGPGVLAGGVPGVRPASVMIIGGGVVGANAAEVALGMGASVAILDRDPNRLRELSTRFAGRCTTIHSDSLEIDRASADADAVIGAVLVRGERAPWVMDRRHLRRLKPRSVLVDVSIDQGGCFETSRATTHSEPTFEVDGILHYCVANMPAAVPATATRALTNATLPWIIKLADLGLDGALQCEPGLRPGVSIVGGQVISEPFARAAGR